MWLPPAPESELMMIMKSFLEVFPEGTLWGGLEFPGFYLIGGHRSFKQTPVQLATLSEKLSRIEDLGEWAADYRDPAKLRQLYLLDATGLAKLVRDAPAVTDHASSIPSDRRLSRPSAITNSRASSSRPT